MEGTNERISIVGKWHNTWQQEMLKSSNNKAQLEKEFSFGKITHFVDFQLKNICIEFQHSPLHSLDFVRRSEFYTLDGKTLIWIFDVQEDYQKGFLKLFRDVQKGNSFKVFWSTYQECLNYFSPKLSSNLEVYLHINNGDEDSFSPNLLKIVWAASSNISAMQYISNFKKSFYVEEISFEQFKEHLNKLYKKDYKENPNFVKSKEFNKFKNRWIK